MTAAYDRIGRTYASTRRPDPRIAARIRAALADARSVVNLGAGSGSYEPGDLDVVAVEPSETMIAQRPPGAAPALQGSAEAIPLPDASVDAALAVLTVHHWRDLDRAFAEIRRVARRRAVFLTWDPAFGGRDWLTGDYFPLVVGRDRARFPALETLARLGPLTVEPVPVPADCQDGFFGAFWRRPEAYLDPEVRANISTFDPMSAAELREGLSRLAADLESGAWDERHGDLRALDELDLGYRLVVAAL